jgi:hypothetical protein
VGWEEGKTVGILSGCREGVRDDCKLGTFEG